MADWQNWSFGKNRMRSVLENIDETKKEEKKWYHYICCCFCSQKTITEDDSSYSYREFSEDNNK
tara:strand:- start:1797 stop:1988 length:192 start_codon:yes stop_codon:yes gene_type:complete